MFSISYRDIVEALAYEAGWVRNPDPEFPESLGIGRTYVHPEHLIAGHFHPITLESLSEMLFRDRVTAFRKGMKAVKKEVKAKQRDQRKEIEAGLDAIAGRA